MQTYGRTETTRLLRVVRPALAGVTVGATAAPAPLFAAAVAGDPSLAALVGAASAVGLGLTHGLAAAFEDDGGIQSDDDPARRAALTGGGAFLAAGVPVFPFVFVSDGAFALAFPLLAAVLGGVALLRARYGDADVVEAAVRVVLAGAVAAAVGAGIGSL